MLETESPPVGVPLSNETHTSPDFSKPPPNLVINTSMPPPATPVQQSQFVSPNISLSSQNRFTAPNPRLWFQSRPQHSHASQNPGQDDNDARRPRRSSMRKTVDYNVAIIKSLENRVWQRDYRDRRALQPDVLFLPEVLPPPSYKDNAINAVTTHFVKTATNKMRCPIFCMAWTPEGRRLVTGASSGEFTLWNGLTFNFETILQAHDSPVRSMVWSHNDAWMVTGDHFGYCKYWQSNMNNVKMFQAHKEAIRGLSFSPTDQKIVSCSDDGTLRIWDFARCLEERVLRGHGSDVKCCDWHPQLGLIASGSKDNQQPVKLWDPKSGSSLATLHAHKSTVMDLKWNQNGNWFMTASRDHLLKLFDVRNLSQCVQTFRGHKKEASALAWHPHHEGLIASGGSDGAILFWHVGADKEVGAIDQAHESIVWTLNWHPLGHILCSGSNDHTSKFWTRNRPGDLMRDRYNLNTLPSGVPGAEDAEMDDVGFLPGMAPEDRVENPPIILDDDADEIKKEISSDNIPGLEDTASELKKLQAKVVVKKQPFAKPIPKNFVAQWNETGMTPEEEEEALEGYGSESVLDPINQLINKLIESQPGVKKLEELEPTAIIIYGKLLPVYPGTKLYKKIFQGKDALNKYIRSGKIKEIQDVLPFNESDSDYENYETESEDEGEDESYQTHNGRNSPKCYDLSNPDLDLRRFFAPSYFGEPDGEVESGENSQPGEGQDVDVRLDQDSRTPNYEGDEDLRPLPNKPPSLLNFPEKDNFHRDLDLRNNDYKREHEFHPRDVDGRNSDRGFNTRNNRDFEPRNRNYEGRGNRDFNPRGNREFDSRSRDFDLRKNRDFELRNRDFDSRSRDFDVRGNRDFDYDERSNQDFDQRSRDFEQRGNRDFDFRGNRDFDHRSNQDFDQRGNRNFNQEAFNRNEDYDQMEDFEERDIKPKFNQRMDFDQRKPPGPRNQDFDQRRPLFDRDFDDREMDERGYDDFPPKFEMNPRDNEDWDNRPKDNWGGRPPPLMSLPNRGMDEGRNFCGRGGFLQGEGGSDNMARGRGAPRRNVLPGRGRRPPRRRGRGRF